MELGLRLCDQQNPVVEDNPPACSDHEPIKDEVGDDVGEGKLRSETTEDHGGQLLLDHQEEEEEEDNNHDQHGKEDHGRIISGSGPGPLQLNLLPHTRVLVALSPSKNYSGGGGSPQMELGISLFSNINYGNSSRSQIDLIRASSSNEYHDNSSSSRKKLRLSKDQSALLEDSFKDHHNLNPKEKQALAKQLNLRPRQVEVWFQNKRARTKLKQMEMDSEHLRRWCETLTEENRKLQKELKELRSLKTTTAATTLTVCPSCERVSSSTAPSATATGGGVADVDHSSFLAPTRKSLLPVSFLIN